MLIFVTNTFNAKELSLITAYGTHEKLQKYYDKFKFFCTQDILLNCIKELETYINFVLHQYEDYMDINRQHKLIIRYKQDIENKKLLLTYLISSYYEKIQYDEKLIYL